MPVLDQELYLRAAVESVESQTMADWELLLVDDGSTDTSVEIAEALLPAHPGRIHLLRSAGNEPRGPGSARNQGIAAAKGLYLAFLDADDLYAPEKLAREVALLEATPDAAMLYGPTRWWYEDGKQPDRVEWVGVPTERVYRPPELLRRILLLQEGHIPCTCGVLILREAARSVGGFEERFQLYEDQSLWAKLFLRYPVYVTGLSHAQYRQHAVSASAKAERAGEYHPFRPHPAGLAFLQWLEDHVRDSGVRDRGLTRAFRAAFYPYRHPWQARAVCAGRRIRFDVRRRLGSR